MLTNSIRDLIDYFIPEHIRAELLSRDYFRAQVVVGLISISTITSLLIAIAIFSLVQSNDRMILAIGITIAQILANLFCLIYFRWQGNLAITSNIWLSMGSLTVLAVGLVNGGLLQSRALSLLVIFPVFAFLTLGRRWGVFWGIAILVCIGIFYWVHVAGVSIPQIPPNVHEAESNVLHWIVKVGILIACMLLYEIHLDDLSSKLAHQSDRFAYAASHDNLTGLCNRQLFEKEANHAIDFAINENILAAVIYIDLDDFKPINDNFGHHVGDETLKLVAQRLQLAVRSSDCVARLGGDEFATVLHGVKDSAIIKSIAEKILATISEPLFIEGKILQVSASVGVITIPDNGTELKSVLRRADQTMYQAKQSKNQVHFYKADSTQALS